MCGIAGIVSKRPRPSIAIEAMASLVRHRGPDDEGYLVMATADAAPIPLGGADTPAEAFRSGAAFAPADSIAAHHPDAVLALGSRRLSVLDPSVLGHQPMSTPDRRHWVVYNGEIYNYVELGRELASLGHLFRSHTDTEVVLAAYAEWGPACLHRFNGMWALAIYDTHTRDLFVARDRFGIKPLYYWVAPDGSFCFASEIKQFTGVPGWTAALNRPRAYDFLAWGLLDHTDETLFTGVYQLRGGEYLRLPTASFAAGSDGRVPVTRWYDLQPAAFAGTFDEAAAECRRLLTDSVRLMLRADVPVGSCLSGGIDSSSIVCLIKQLLETQDAASLQKTFSACADVPRFDERHWIDEVVGATAVDARYVYPTFERLAAESRAVVWHQDEPYGSTSIYAQWSVFRLAAENGVTVMLDGQGADEEFGGYHSFFPPFYAGVRQSRSLLAAVAEIRRTSARHGYNRRYAAAAAARLLLPRRWVRSLRAALGSSPLDPPWLDLRALGVSPSDPLAEWRDAASVQALSRAQLTATNLPMLLHWEDRSSMAHSVESRVPYLDHRLAEFALGLPDGFKLSGGVTKRVLRRGMSGILPDRIRDRVDKMAFVTPEACWLRQKRDVFRTRLGAAIDSSRGILAPSARACLEDTAAGRRPFDPTPWRMIAFGEWIDRFGVSVR